MAKLREKDFVAPEGLYAFIQPESHVRPSTSASADSTGSQVATSPVTQHTGVAPSIPHPYSSRIALATVFFPHPQFQQPPLIHHHSGPYPANSGASRDAAQDGQGSSSAGGGAGGGGGGAGTGAGAGGKVSALMKRPKSRDTNAPSFFGGLGLGMTGINNSGTGGIDASEQHNLQVSGASDSSSSSGAVSGSGSPSVGTPSNGSSTAVPGITQSPNLSPLPIPGALPKRRSGLSAAFTQRGLKPLASNNTGESSRSNQTSDSGESKVATPGSAAATYPQPDLRHTLSFNQYTSPNPSNGAFSSSSSSSKPRNAFKGTSSTFVKSYEGLPLSQSALRALAPGAASPHPNGRTDGAPGSDPMGREVTWGFVTVGKGVNWVDLSIQAIARAKEPIAKLQFSIFPTCIDANRQTASHDRMDVLVGFASGDVLWFDPICARYTRLNKSGCISSSPCTSITWMPGSENNFMSSHADGGLILWDKDREDPSSFLIPSSPPPVHLPVSLHLTPGSPEADNGPSHPDGGPFEHGHLYEDMVVTRQPHQLDRKGSGKYNPISHWKVSRKAVTDFAFSPDFQYVAVVSEDGCLRVIDSQSEKLLDVFASYFGALTCVAWSPDGRFVLAGGQDDLVTVWAPFEQRVVARCQGHASFVTGIASDDWKSNERTSRFASVSEDCKLILWDLSGAALHRPRSQYPYNRRISVNSSLSLVRRRTLESTGHLPMSFDRHSPAFHPALNRSDVAYLQASMTRSVSSDILSQVVFLPNLVVTVSKSGEIQAWLRPVDRPRRVKKERSRTVERSGSPGETQNLLRQEDYSPARPIPLEIGTAL